jgi:bifunctional DNase/RNase
MTHDLLRNFIVETGLRLERITITELRDNTFYALIELIDNQENLLTLDSRPSDAIALAVRLDCAIFVEQNVLDISATTVKNDSVSDGEVASASEDWPDLIG